MVVNAFFLLTVKHEANLGYDETGVISKWKRKEEYIMNSQTNQMFVAQSVNGPFAIDAKAYLTSKMRKVTLSGEITSESIESLITICELLIQESESDPITLYFNTSGGNVDAAYHLIDFMEGAPVKFYGVVSEICASAGALVFASLPKGHRFIMSMVKS